MLGFTTLCLEFGDLRVFGQMCFGQKCLRNALLFSMFSFLGSVKDCINEHSTCCLGKGLAWKKHASAIMLPIWPYKGLSFVLLMDFAASAREGYNVIVFRAHNYALYVEECLGLMVGLCLGMWQSSLGIMVGLEWKSLFGRCMWCEGGGKVVGLELCYWCMQVSLSLFFFLRVCMCVCVSFFFGGGGGGGVW